jgi:hypothetical protein
MAVVQIPNLPVASTLTGTEQLEIVQAGASCRTTTQDVADLAGVTAFPGYNAMFLSGSTLTNGGVTIANLVPLSAPSPSTGWTLASGSQMTAANSGTYVFTVGVQAEKSDAGNHDVDVWLAKNGSNLGASNFSSTVIGSGVRAQMSKTYVLDLNASDYVQVYWSSSNASMTLAAYSAGSNPSRPSIPSVSVSTFLVKQS